LVVGVLAAGDVVVLVVVRRFTAPRVMGTDAAVILVVVPRF
jgi:hypothetical protein